MFSFFKTTIDDIVQDISAKVEKLHIIAAAHAEAATLHQAEVQRRTQLAALATAEFDRAKRIAAKFEDLVS